MLDARCNVVAVAVVGFFLVGITAIGCVAFGIIEIASQDAIFLNDGLGEVLTVLGVYFTVPYLFIAASFIAASSVCPRLPLPDLSAVPAKTMMVVSVIMFIVQQAFTNNYLVILLGENALWFLSGDIIVLFLLIYFKLNPISGMAYTLLFVAKMDAQWGKAWETTTQPLFGPNGVRAMLFLAIPIIQIPLYIATINEKGMGISDAFTANFNLYLCHLLHCLDVINMYQFAFIPPGATLYQNPTPEPFKTLLCVLITIGFAGNNIGVLYLFQRRSGAEIVIPFLPKSFREATRRLVEGHESSNTADKAHKQRMFQYYLLMLAILDIPMLVSRIELWRRRYYNLDIFVAKNLKNIVDVTMLLLRVGTANLVGTGAAV